MASLCRDNFLAKVHRRWSALASANTNGLYCRAVISHKSAPMRNSILVLVTLVISFSVSGQILPANDSVLDQKNHINLNATYFILGTLSDYLGRFTYVNNSDQVDRYYPYEKSLRDFIDSLIFDELYIKITVNERDETFSKDLSLLLNSFYGSDKLLIDSLFKDNDQIFSFLTGKYYRYGRVINDSLFLIQMANSPNHKICDTLLKKAGCKNVHFKYLKNIPAQFIYFFVPPPELKDYFNSVSDQKEILKDAYYRVIKDLMKFEKDELEEMKKETLQRDLSRFLEIINQ